MNEYKKFIKKAYPLVCEEWQAKINAKFPQLILKLKINRWYIGEDSGNITYNTGKDKTNYGRTKEGEWLVGEWDFGLDRERLATDKEVEGRLIKEAKKRFGDNVVQCLLFDSDSGSINYSKVEYDNDHNNLWARTVIEVNIKIFEDGKWAEIMKSETKELTVAEISDKLGYEVKIIK